MANTDAQTTKIVKTNAQTNKMANTDAQSNKIVKTNAQTNKIVKTNAQTDNRYNYKTFMLEKCIPMQILTKRLIQTEIQIKWCLGPGTRGGHWNSLDTIGFRNSGVLHLPFGIN